MSSVTLSLDEIDAQEQLFARAFETGDISVARPLYRPDIVYVSPTTRLFGWPARIVGVEQALEFIQLTITGLTDVSYGVDERALIDGAGGAFVRVRFDFTTHGARLRSRYVVIYRYRHGSIAEQELYYDPSGRFERL